MLDPAGRRQLNQLLHAHGVGPRPHLLHLAHRLSDLRSGHHTTAGHPPDLLTEALELTLRRCRAWVPPRALLSRLQPRGRRGVLFAPLACGLGTQKTINHVQGFRLRVELPPQYLPGLAVASARDQPPACLADEPHVAAGQAPPVPVPPSPDHLFHAPNVRMFDRLTGRGAEQTRAGARRVIRSGLRRLGRTARSSRGDAGTPAGRGRAGARTRV